MEHLINQILLSAETVVILGQILGTMSGCTCRAAWIMDRMPDRCLHQWSVGKENDGTSFQAAGLAALQLTLWICVLWHTCRIIMWWIWLVGSKVGMSGCTWMTVRAVVRSSVESTLNVFLVFCVLVGCARFGRQQGHVVTERVQWSTVTRRGRLTELLCYLYKRTKKGKNSEVSHNPNLNQHTNICWPNKPTLIYMSMFYSWSND